MTISSASQVGRNVASTAATVANSEAEHEEPEDRRADAEPDAERRAPTTFFFSSSAGELELEPRDRRCVLGDLLGRAAETAVRAGASSYLSRGGGHGPSSRSPLRARSRRRAQRRARATGSARRPASRFGGFGRASCGPEGAVRVPPAGSSVGRLALRARLDQARLQLAEEVRVVGQRLRRPSP